MRFITTCLVTALSATFLFVTSVGAQENESVPAMAPFSAAEAIPVVSEVNLNHHTGDIHLPQGWYFISMTTGGFVLEHEDGSRLRVIRCVQETYYRVAWSLTYEFSGMDCVASSQFRINDALPDAPDSDGVTVRVQVPNNCLEQADGIPSISDDCQSRIPAVAITVPWPTEVVEALQTTLNAETRRGVCTR